VVVVVVVEEEEEEVSTRIPHPSAVTLTPSL